jgi:hypothetical protein
LYNDQKDENLVKFLSQTSKFTQSLPRKIQKWSKQKENKLKRLFVDEGRSIHAIARMLGAREYEIAEAIERFGFAVEPVQLKPRPHPMKGIKKSEYVPKWAREQNKNEDIGQQLLNLSGTTFEPQVINLTSTPYFGVTPAPTVTTTVTVAPSVTPEKDPRVKSLETFLEQRNHYEKQLNDLRVKNFDSMSIEERVKHDLELAKANEMYIWFAHQYSHALQKLAETLTESNRWKDAK